MSITNFHTGMNLFSNFIAIKYGIGDKLNELVDCK